MIYLCLAYSRPYSLGEDDEYRITREDERTRRELIHYLQQVRLYEESLAQIRKAKDERTNSVSGKGCQSYPRMLQRSTSAKALNTAADQEDQVLDSKNVIPAIYLKLEGMALLQLGFEDESHKLLHEYIRNLLSVEVCGNGRFGRRQT